MPWRTRSDESLAAGACGLSTGLMYAPGESAPFPELERLCRGLGRRDKIYATHMRDYGARLIEAIDEQIGLARRSGRRLQISHLQAVGEANWSRQATALERIERARDEGVDIAFDCYPYVAGSTVLNQLLPQSALAGGIPGMLERLADPMERTRIASETIARMAHRWTDIVISAIAGTVNQPAVGRSIQEIAVTRACEPIDVVLDLLLEERGAVNMVAFNQSQENLRQTLTHPLSNIISDGFYVTGGRIRGFMAPFRNCWEASAARITGWHFRKRSTRYQPAGWTALGCAIAAASSPGFGDVAVFDAGRIGSPATYDQRTSRPRAFIACFAKASSQCWIGYAKGSGGAGILPAPHREGSDAILVVVSPRAREQVWIGCSRSVRRRPS